MLLHDAPEITPETSEAAELEALIEEARRRAQQRRLRFAKWGLGAGVAALLVYFGFSGGGFGYGDDLGDGPAEANGFPISEGTSVVAAFDYPNGIYSARIRSVIVEGEVSSAALVHEEIRRLKSLGWRIDPDRRPFTAHPGRHTRRPAGFPVFDANREGIDDLISFGTVENMRRQRMLGVARRKLDRRATHPSRSYVISISPPEEVCC